MWIRAESAADHDAIRRVTGAAFAAAAHAGGNEAAIVDALRAAGALAVSLVADIDGRVAGHAAASPVVLDGGGGGWFGLGPVAVAPADQGHGVGSALVRAVLDALRRGGAAGCVVLGDPGWYRRLGFAASPLRYPGAPAGHFLAWTARGEAPAATVAYHPAFDAPADAPAGGTR